jgi:hypothetical protein
VKFQAGFATPLAELLLNVAATMYEMYADHVDSKGAVVTLVARRPDRIINPEVVYAFVGVENVKFAFLANSDCCTGGGCPSLPPDSLGGLGKTMMEWVLTTGFLEQVFRNEQVRRDIRNRVGPLIRARRGVSADGLHRNPSPN